MYFDHNLPPDIIVRASFLRNTNRPVITKRHWSETDRLNHVPASFHHFTFPFLDPLKLFISSETTVLNQPLWQNKTITFYPKSPTTKFENSSNYYYVTFIETSRFYTLTAGLNYKERKLVLIISRICLIFKFPVKCFSVCFMLCYVLCFPAHSFTSEGTS